MPDGSEAGDPLALVLTGPFTTRVALDAERLRVSGYGDQQEALVAHLRGDSHGEWSFRAPRAGASGLRFTAVGHANESVLPESLVSCGGTPLVEELQRLFDPGLRAEDAGWVLASASIEFFDFGVGVVALRFELPPLPRRDLRQKAREVERVTVRLAAAAAAPVAAVAEAFASAVDEAIEAPLVRPPWFDRSEGEAGSVFSATPGALHYLHHTYVLTAKPGTLRMWVAEAPGLLPGFFETVVFRDRAYLPGMSSSVILHEADAGENPAWILRVRVLMSAHFAWCLEMDRSLSIRLNKLASDARGARARDLVSATDDIVNMYESIRLTRAQLDTILVNLGGASVGIWQAIAAVQRWDHLQAALDAKLDTLQSIHRVRLDSVAAHHAQNLNRIVLWFTAFTVVSSGVALVDFVTTQQLLGPNGARFGLALLIAALCGLLVRLLMRQGSRQR